MLRTVLAAMAATMLATAAHAQAPPVPRAIFTDPPADAKAPAASEVLHIPSGGVQINGLAYLAAGPGPHPTVVIAHGLPGNEKNLDLAQAIRRGGWNAVTFNYRGSWGSPGRFSFTGNLDDARAVLAYIRDPANAQRLRIDPRRVVLMGHSMGGWVTSQVAASDEGLLGAALISSADMSAPAAAPKATRLQLARANMEALDTTDEDMADQIAGLGAYSFAAAAPGLAKTRLLILTSDDGLAPPAEKLFLDLKQRGARVRIVHANTDHSWNSARIRLETEILTWLAGLPR
ncbi:MAG: alpha/beta fold hydrolase [Phenylobacterium sp.]|uniref:alpha/beta hydrolase family protein n=1 Tax=Phenylobacterium sp. TaxID=1871053 RepID=UPI001A474E7D|nr:alpha/beta hydrolase [Phenylobacterium sp.]MBL8554319.1 alpha/beta fold hydrolase [Phenylobacterium sp.]